MWPAGGGHLPTLEINLSTLFFYGTLRHKPLLEIVLGRVLNDEDVIEGIAEGYTVRAVRDADFPIIMFGGQGAPGFVVTNLTPVEVERLNFYEGGFDYSLTPIQIKTEDGSVTAQVYFPNPDQLQAGGPWRLEDWESNWSDITCEAALEAMSYFGTKSHEELDFMFPSIRARAASKIAASHESLALSPSGFTRDDVNLERLERKHADFLL